LRAARTLAPHYCPYEDGAYRPTTFADPRNTFHEKAMSCRAAENTVFFAGVNYASPGSGTTSAMRLAISASEPPLSAWDDEEMRKAAASHAS
jgi:hypothetical protein